MEEQVILDDLVSRVLRNGRPAFTTEYEHLDGKEAARLAMAGSGEATKADPEPSARGAR